MPRKSELPEEAIESKDRCPYCCSHSSSKLFVENEFQYVACDECDLIYLASRVKECFVHLIYDNHSYHSTEVSRYHEVIAQKRLDLFHALPPEARIHEDGAGNGAFVAACRGRGLRVTGSDVGESAVSRAKEAFGVELCKGTLEECLSTRDELDALASFNVLCHLYAPWDYLDTANQLLKPGGQLLLRTGDRGGVGRKTNWGNWSAPEHVYHFTGRLLKEMLKKSGFDLVSVVPAFDSDYPYWWFEGSRSGWAPKRWIARKFRRIAVRTWNFLKLPKDDIYLLAVKR